MSAICTGSESTLKNCWSFGWGKSNCDHSKDAGVICSGIAFYIFLFICLCKIFVLPCSTSINIFHMCVFLWCFYIIY